MYKESPEGTDIDPLLVPLTLPELLQLLVQLPLLLDGLAQLALELRPVTLLPLHPETLVLCVSQLDYQDVVLNYTTRTSSLFMCCR